MRKTLLFIIITVTVLIEAVCIIYFIPKDYDYKNYTVSLNELVYEIEQNYGNTNKYPTNYEYAIIDNNSNLKYKTSENVSTSLIEAYKNKDTIIDLKEGKLIVYNSLEETIKLNNNRILIMLSIAVVIQIISIIIYYIFLDYKIFKPFKKMKAFANRVTSGNLDVPLEMDKANNFGAFTEAFDIMRSEIKKSREQERKAIESKKELVAKLSHDIKTPIASIKSSSEMGMMIAKEEKEKNYFNSINQKADQINTLITNLFNSTLEELEELKINPTMIKSNAIYELINKSDYLNRNRNYTIPECNIYADIIRLQQIFDNIFANSYKYANTEIETKSYIEKDYLVVEIKDFGDTVKDEELPLLTEKFKRGSNTTNIDGVGLGLYISKELLNKMDGELEIENAKPGFIVKIYLRII